MTHEIIETLIIQRCDVADGIIRLDLAPLTGELLPRFEAGAHIDVHLGSGLIRQYSLCNDPAEDHRYRLGILLDVNGRGGSAEIHRDFTEGKTVRIGKPRNKFPLIAEAQHSVLIAGGIGITPLLAMAYELSAKGKSFELHYLTRTLRRAAFLDELRQARFAANAHVYFDDSSPSERFDTSRDIPAPEFGKHLYICGPNGFMTAMISAARAKGWPDTCIHLEYFSASNEIDNSTGSFLIEARRSGKTITVNKNQTAAQAMQAAGIQVPLSCESGICGSCLTAIIEGVPDHRDSYMTDAEHAANAQMTPCCSRAFTAKIVLDI
jgi:vanillate monooxygenase ferredoxin subunit